MAENLSGGAERMGSAGAALQLVEARVCAAVRCERAAGQPLKAVWHRVARRLGVSARRVRAFHYHEVQAADVRAAELLAAHADLRAELVALEQRLNVIRGLIDADLGGAAGRMAGCEMAAGGAARGTTGGVLDGAGRTNEREG